VQVHQHAASGLSAFAVFRIISADNHYAHNRIVDCQRFQGYLKVMSQFDIFWQIMSFVVICCRMLSFAVIYQKKAVTLFVICSLRSFKSV